MRIRAFHVNGFGVLADVGLEDLSPGLNVILGDNGAGKSTLLEFFRAVLFGFRRRGSAIPRYEPLRGGTHGGTLTVVLEDGSEYIVARAPGKAVVGVETVTARTNSSPPRDLVEIVGRATRDVFENVFAFSLFELDAVESLDSENIRARLHAAAAGTGARAVPEARKQLEKELKETYSQRGQSALGRVLEELDSVLRRRRELEGQTAEYVALRKELEQLTSEIEASHTARKQAESVLNELSTILAAWPDWEELRRLTEDLAAIGNVVPLEERSEERVETAIRTIQEREQLVKQAEDAWNRAREEAERAWASLGEGWTEYRGAGLDTGDAASATIAEFGRELDAAREDVARAEEALRHAADELAKRSRERAALEEEQSSKWPTPPRLFADIEQDLEALRALRSEAAIQVGERAKRAELEGRRHAAEAEVRRLRESPEPIAPPARIPLFIAIGALACASVAFRISVPAAIALLAVFVVAATIAIRGHRKARSIVRARRAEEIREAEGRLKDLDDRIAAADENIGKRQAELNAGGVRFGISVVSTPTDVDEAERRLLMERDSATAYAAQETRIHEARHAEAEAADRRDELEKALAAVQGAFRTVQERWQSWCAEAGLPAGLEPATAADFLSRARQARVLSAAGEQRAAEKDEARRRLDDAHAQLKALLTQSGDADLEAFRKHAERWHALLRTEAAIRSVEERLATRAGSPEAWPAMKIRLEQTTLHDLQAQEAAARARVNELRAAWESMTRRQGELDARLREMETSEEQEKLAARMAELRTRANDLLGQWAVRRICIHLLDEARQRFEHSHQPAIIRRAGEHLQRITGGAYVQLIRPLDSQNVVAQTRDGSVRELGEWNRGLLEQIYLCLRLGFIEDYARSAEPLPVIIDDAFANFDPGHARRAAETLAEFAKQHQVLYMTCHPETVDYLRAAEPGAACYRLDGYRLAKMDEYRAP